MASKSRQKRLAEQVADLTHGQLNSAETSELGQKISNDSTFFGAVMNTITSANRADVVKGLGHPIKAVVLYAWKARVELHGGETAERLHVKARIPEIDIVPLPTALPIDNNPNDEFADWSTINLHTTFIAQDGNLNIPKPGDIVGVDFGNRDHLYNPIYYKIIARNAGPPADLSARNAFASGNKQCADDSVSSSFPSDPQTAPPTPQPTPPTPQPTPTPPESTYSPPDNPPEVGFYIGPSNYLSPHIKNKTYPKNCSGEPRHTLGLGVFEKNKGYSWLTRLVESGVNFLSYRINGAAATRGSLGKTAAQRGNPNALYTRYTKEMTGGRTVPQEMLYVQKLGQEINPDFKVHAWGSSGVYGYGSGPPLGSGRLANYDTPATLQEALTNAETEAKTIADVFKQFQGEIIDYHWNPEVEALKGGTTGWKSKNRNRKKSIEWNDAVFKHFVATLRASVPNLKLWYNGWFSGISREVLDLFDYQEPQCWGAPTQVFKYKYDVIPNSGGPWFIAGKPISWCIPTGGMMGGCGWTSNASRIQELDDLIVQYKPEVLHFFVLDSFMWQGYNGVPSTLERIKAIRDRYKSGTAMAPGNNPLE